MIVFYVIVEFLFIYLVEVRLVIFREVILIVGECFYGFGLMCCGFGCCLLMLLALSMIGIRCILEMLLVIYIIFVYPSYSPPTIYPSSPHTSTPSPHPLQQSPSPSHLHPQQKQTHSKHKNK